MTKFNIKAYAVIASRAGTNGQLTNLATLLLNSDQLFPDERNSLTILAEKLEGQSFPKSNNPGERLECAFAEADLSKMTINFLLKSSRRGITEFLEDQDPNDYKPAMNGERLRTHRARSHMFNFAQLVFHSEMKEAFLLLVNSPNYRTPKRLLTQIINRAFNDAQSSKIEIQISEIVPLRKIQDVWDRTQSRALIGIKSFDDKVNLDSEIPKVQKVKIEFSRFVWLRQMFSSVKKRGDKLVVVLENSPDKGARELENLEFDSVEYEYSDGNSTRTVDHYDDTIRFGEFSVDDDKRSQIEDLLASLKIENEAVEGANTVNPTDERKSYNYIVTELSVLVDDAKNAIHSELRKGKEG